MRGLMSAEWLKGPEGPCRIPIDLFSVADKGRTILGNKRPLLHPTDEQFNFVSGQFSFGGHLQLGIGVSDRRDEQAVIGLPSDQDWTARATCQQAGSTIQRQLAVFCRGFCRVAFITVFDQQRAYGTLKEFGCCLFVRNFVPQQNFRLRRAPQDENTKEKSTKGDAETVWNESHENLLKVPGNPFAIPSQQPCIQSITMTINPRCSSRQRFDQVIAPIVVIDFTQFGDFR